MKRFLFLFAALIAVCQAYSQQKPMIGYTPEAANTQFKLEEKYDAQLKAGNLDAWLKRLAARPHHIGSPYGKANAEFIRDQFKSWGYDAQIGSYKILFPTPKVRVL